MVPGSLAIISATFPDDERGKAIGPGPRSRRSRWSSPIGRRHLDRPRFVACDLLHQRSARGDRALPQLRHVPETRETKKRPLDVAGAALATAGLGSLVYGLIESSTLGLAHPRIIAALAAGAVLLAAFVVVEWRSASPMMPLELFRSSAFCGANVITLFLYAALAGCLFFVR